jgi:hypothetical protein
LRSSTLQQFAVSDTPRQLLSSDPVKPRFVAVHSGHDELLSFGLLDNRCFFTKATLRGTAAELDGDEPGSSKSFVRMHVFALRSLCCPGKKMLCSGTLGDTEQRLSISQSRRRK